MSHRLTPETRANIVTLAQLYDQLRELEAALQGLEEKAAERDAVEARVEQLEDAIEDQLLSMGVRH